MIIPDPLNRTCTANATSLPGTKRTPDEGGENGVLENKAAESGCNLTAM